MLPQLKMRHCGCVGIIIICNVTKQRACTLCITEQLRQACHVAMYVLHHSHTACKIIAMVSEVHKKDGMESSSTAVESVKLP